MSLLRGYEYERLDELGRSYEEDEGSRYLVLLDCLLPAGLYTVERCRVLVVIPQNYPDDGIDMLWVAPCLELSDGGPIPAASPLGSGNNRSFKGVEFCRWSRHWNTPTSRWRPGRDDVNTILHRVDWALQNPKADRG